jgi:hypothetical protein
MIKKVIDEVYVRADVDSREYDWETDEERVERMRNEAQSLKKDIDRHCDSTYVQIDYESHWECSFCGCEMAAEDDYECCYESVEEHNKNLQENR